MPVASLSIVQIRTKRHELGSILAKLINFENFHPSKREGLTQDVGILLVSSHFLSIYSNASELLTNDALRLPIMKGDASKVVESFNCDDVFKLVQALVEELETARKHLPLFISDEDKKGLRDLVQAIRDLALAMFNNLSRILVAPDVPGSITLEGYVPANSVERLKEDFEDQIVKIQPVSKRGPQDPYVPSLLVNSRVVSLFENLSLMKGVPKYNEIDPTPIIALVFPFFFGIMFGDVGHGIALLGFGIFLLLKTKYDYWGKLIVVFGVAATAFGFIRGSFFGIEFPSPLQNLIKLPEVFSAHFTLSFVPLLIEIAIVIGTFHLASAYAIGFVNEIRSNEYSEAFLDRLPTLTLYSSIVPLGLALVGAGYGTQNVFTSAARTPVFYEILGLSVPVSVTATISLVIVISSLVVLVVGRPIMRYISARTRRMNKAVKSLESSSLEAIARPFEFFMNTISYVRLGVLLISTTLLGNLIAGFLSFGVIGIFLAVFSNIAVISLEGIILYVQDMRLHLYEWLPKFYSGSGTPFTPFVKGSENFQINFVFDRPNLIQVKN
jgi:V/A-type H+/Na+-transporting ATPase subunit I